MKKLPSFLLNKYVLTLIALFTWLLILDETDLFTLYKYRSEVSNLEDNKENLQKNIIELKQSLEALNNNPKELERFAREHHYMKRDDEDLFVILHE